MNRINPLYLGLLLVAILAILIFKLNEAKSDLSLAKENFKETMLISTELTGLRDVYGNENKSKSSLLRILSQSTLKSAEIKQSLKKTGITINSESMDISSLNYLMGKLLNGAYNISAMTVKKLSDTKVSLHMEVKW